MNHFNELKADNGMNIFINVSFNCYLLKTSAMSPFAFFHSAHVLMKTLAFINLSSPDILNKSSEVEQTVLKSYLYIVQASNGQNWV